ncbi:MAG: class I SAM-dependent methyltransferase [Symploca sp. SIO2D2]|nr:class I SAM-dependent methyltransferase [Symploca sp. SIO2D2]
MTSLSKGHIPQGNNKTVWDVASANYAEDDTELTILGEPVMERWEEPYMKALATIAASNGGRVLEIGFGMGISASFIQSFPIEEHVIIEANQGVFQRLLEFQKAATHQVRPLFGFWDDVVPTLADSSFDGILYDTFPLSEEDLHIHQFKFIEQAYRLLKPNGVLTYCNLMSWGNLKQQYPDDINLFTETQIPHLKAAGFSNFQTDIVEVNPPQTCQYYSTKTIVAPTIRK